MNKFTTKVAAAALTMTLATVSGQAIADSSKPIVIPTHNWSSQIVMAYVIGGIFEDMGNNVEYVSADTQGVYESIRNGDVTISHEVWQSTFGASFYNAMAKGGVIDAGTHAAMTLEEVGVPQWVIDKNMCPGLPNYEALKNCVDVFFNN
jgi:glycine betaine/proline transport system substrate-binding protein